MRRNTGVAGKGGQQFVRDLDPCKPAQQPDGDDDGDKAALGEEPLSTMISSTLLAMPEIVRPAPASRG